MDYSERKVQKQILRARGSSRDSLLDRENTREVKNKITFTQFSKILKNLSRNTSFAYS